MCPVDGWEIADRRMHNVRLSGPPLTTAADVVRWFGAVQSQDYGPARWSLGQRSPGILDADVRRLFDEGGLLRTHVLRPTWHFVLPEDIRWLLALTGPRVHALNAYYYRQVGLDAAELDKAERLVADALRGGNHLTRKALVDVFHGAGIGTEGFRAAYLLMSAELNGVICSGPMKGRQHTYALLDERAPEVQALSREAALAELTRRYFTSHGPATVKDFRWWSSLTVADINAGLELVGADLDRVDVDGVTYWYAPAPRPPAVPSPTVHLVQGYDEYLVGYVESKHLLDVAGLVRWQTGDRTVFVGAVLLDGQLAGHWKRTVRKADVLVDVSLYRSLGAAAEDALRTAVDRHAGFLGMPAAVAVTLIGG
jgi:hypothetical protein